LGAFFGQRLSLGRALFVDDLEPGKYCRRAAPPIVGFDEIRVAGADVAVAGRQQCASSGHPQWTAEDSVLDQRLGDVTAVNHCEIERRLTVQAGDVEPCAAFDQKPCDISVTLATGDHQRREPPIVGRV